MSQYNHLLNICKNNGFCLLALIDPDKKNDLKLNTMLNTINKSSFDAILIGGSKIEDNLFEDRVTFIKENTSLPLISFPGSSNQISPNIPAMLYLNLISGRNPKYLIEEQVLGAQKIKKFNIEAIPTAYILLKSESSTSVVNVSQTTPLNIDNMENVLSHALAGQYMGNKFIYFDNGSGSSNKVSFDLINYISKHIKTPIIVGGGVKSRNEAIKYSKNGASMIVIGNALENNQYIN
tara:strand:- start:73 stop:780 length:708 start_codon:yes stop_codon:yes gene_type:complete